MYRVVTAEQDCELVDRARARIADEWPEFMLHDPVASFLTNCYERFPQYQFVLTKEDREEPVAIANSIPLAWDGEVEDLPDDGWDWALTKGMDDLEQGRQPNILCALQILVFSHNRGQGISPRAVKAMKQIGSESGLRGMIAPVRPSLKSKYPLTPIEQYITWTNGDSRPFDPWLRVHFNLGARVVKPCHTAMRITGSRAEWEEWTRMRFPQSGKYIVPGALTPVEFDIDSDIGTYLEPNVWMYHPPQ